MATYDLTKTAPSKLAAGDILNVPYSGKQQAIELPPGRYTIECWGGYGIYSTASPTSGHTYGYGGYTKGTMQNDQKRSFYIYVGGKGTNTLNSSYYDGGWNGGGGKRSGSKYNDNGTGGGATDVCLVASAVTRDSYGRYIRTDASYKSRLIVAGGGGGGRSNSKYSYGNYSPVNSSNSYAGQMSNAATSYSGAQAPGFGYGSASTQSTDDYASGGGGWYGGGTNGDSYGGGGSGFVWSEAHKGYVPSGYSVPESLKMTDTLLQVGGTTANPSGSYTGNGYCRITVLEVAAAFEAWCNPSGAFKEIEGLWMTTGAGIWKEVEQLTPRIGESWKT